MYIIVILGYIYYSDTWLCIWGWAKNPVLFGSPTLNFLDFAISHPLCICPTWLTWNTWNTHEIRTFNKKYAHLIRNTYTYLQDNVPMGVFHVYNVSHVGQYWVGSCWTFWAMFWPFWGSKNWFFFQVSKIVPRRGPDDLNTIYSALWSRVTHFYAVSRRNWLEYVHVWAFVGHLKGFYGWFEGMLAILGVKKSTFSEVSKIVPRRPPDDFSVFSTASRRHMMHFTPVWAQNGFMYCNARGY